MNTVVLGSSYLPWPAPPPPPRPHLVLQDGDKMVTLKLFLDSINPSSPALSKLHAEILTFTNRIEQIVAAAKEGL